MYSRIQIQPELVSYYYPNDNLMTYLTYPLQEVGRGLGGAGEAIWWPPGLTGICKEDVVDGGWPGAGECPPPTSEPPPDEPEKCPVVLFAFTGTVTGMVENPWRPWRSNWITI